MQPHEIQTLPQTDPFSVSFYYLVLVDECALGIDACDSNAVCTDIAAGYTCECNDGYWGDGYSCQG